MGGAESLVRRRPAKPARPAVDGPGRIGNDRPARDKETRRSATAGVVADDRFHA